MNRIILIVIFFGFTSTIAQGQRLREADDELDKRVFAMQLSGPQMALLEMKRELNLNETQLQQVEKLSEERFARMSEAEMQIDDPIALQKAFREIHAKLDKTLSGILTQSQWLHYIALEGKQHLNMFSGKDEE
jgi:hypothetical protein